MSIFQRSESIYLPRSLKTDVAGFTFFAKLLSFTKRDRHFIIDFSSVNWFDANLCALLAAIVTTNRSFGARFSGVGIKDSKLWNTLYNIGMLALLNGDACIEGKNSAIPLRHFDMNNEEIVEKYIYQFILKSELVPDMSPGAQRKVYRSIFEIYQNSVMHSGAKHNFVCGQYFNYRGTLALTMVEIGHTFKDNVCAHHPDFKTMSGMECLEWAVQKGNTTKKADETGGLGLDLIREFLKLNKGKLQILSADGYWEEKKGVNFAVNCNTSFQGSVVNIEFNLRDANRYSTPEELDIKSIL